MIAEAFDEKRNGFNKTNTCNKTKEFFAEIMLTNESNDYRNSIKEILNAELLKKIAKEGYITYTQHFDTRTQHYILSAKLNVNEPSLNNIHVSINNTFFVNKVQFTEEELIDAVKNTYPERLI